LVEMVNELGEIWWDGRWDEITTYWIGGDGEWTRWDGKWDGIGYDKMVDKDGKLDEMRWLVEMVNELGEIWWDG